jgi:hypothetical protein
MRPVPIAATMACGLVFSASAMSVAVGRMN